MILFTKGCTLGMEEKKNEMKKISRLVALPSPLLWYGGRLFSGVQERRKQAGPTLSGRGIWSNGKKVKAGLGTVRICWMNLFWWGSKIFRRTAVSCKNILNEYYIFRKRHLVKFYVVVGLFVNNITVSSIW